MENCNMYDIDRKEWKRYIRLNKRRQYINYRMNQISNIILKRSYEPVYDKYAKHSVLSFDETNKLIESAILNGQPFWTGRYGGTELQAMVQVINKELGLNNELDQSFKALCNNAGFFSDNISGANDFTKLMLDAYWHMDLHAIWPQFMEDYFIARHSNPEKVKLTILGQLEPWNIRRYTDRVEEIKLWTVALKQKRVLVIHPFVDTIREQYEKKRIHIFDNLMPAERILPEFELLTLKAVQTSAGERDERFATWFEALKCMVEECRRMEFDVAIIGCGAYGFLLSCEIKKMGRVAIHLGGATQLMFGIMGKRWETTFKDIVNDSWTRPGEHEKIRNGTLVEDGCYW